VGAPLKPVAEGTPGFNPARGAGIGGAFQVLQARQVGSLQQAEIAKYEKRLAELQPRIDAFLDRGHSVELTLIVERPKRRDVLCAAGVFCDPSQLTYFLSLYISRVLDPVRPAMPRPRTTTPSHATMGAPGGRDSFIPPTHQGGSIIEEREIPHLTVRNPDHRIESAKLTLDPQRPLVPIAPIRPPVRPAEPRPQLDPATRRALAAAPARVYVVSENINQYGTAHAVIQTLAGNPAFGEVRESMGGGVSRRSTIISYRSDLDSAKAEALAEIVRSHGVPTARIELSGSGDGDPGVLTIWFGRDVER
jgi:hypothetical protein